MFDGGGPGDEPSVWMELQFHIVQSKQRRCLVLLCVFNYLFGRPETGRSNNHKRSVLLGKDMSEIGKRTRGGGLFSSTAGGRVDKNKGELERGRTNLFKPNSHEARLAEIFANIDFSFSCF